MRPGEERISSRGLRGEEEGLGNNNTEPDVEDPKPEDTDGRERVQNISYFTLFRFSSRLDKVLIGVALIAAVVIGAIVPFSIKVVADMFQLMINYEISIKVAKPDSEKFLQDMHTFGITYSSIGLVIFVGAYLSSSLMTLTAGNQIFRLRIAYLKAALNQDFAYFDTHQTGDFAAKMAQDVVKMEEGIGDKVTSFVTNITTAVGCVAMAIVQGWKLALLCLTSTPLSFLLVGITGKLSQHLAKKGAIASGKASALAEEVLSSIRTVYTFNGQQKEIEHYRNHLAEARKTHIWKGNLDDNFESSTGLTMGLVSCSIFFSYALSFYLGVRLIVTDPEHYNASVMFAVFFGILIGTMNLGMCAPLISSFGSARGAAAYIYHLLNNVPSINPQRDDGIRPVIEGNIKLKNVVFHYPNREITVLSDVSLSVKRGQSVALVGPSGSGKSTIIQLISRWYDVDSGHVYVDGHDVQNLSVRWLRAHIGLVGQEPVLFDTTVRENIRYGREDATDEDIQEAAKQANAHHFIIKLPKKYETHVGEGGASLSGGQKQRIAIARALVRNPAILLLDEATSALDSASEAKVQQALDTASKGRTTVTVAHRLSTIRNVDHIYVMKDGKITESGTHDELMQKKGQYYDMVTVQEPLEDERQKKKVAVDESEMSREDSKISIKSMKTDEETNLEETVNKLKKMSFLRVMLLNSPEWRSLTIGIICATTIGFSQPLFILVFGNLFGEMSNPDLDELMSKAKTVAIICIGIGLVFFFSSFCESVAFGRAGGYLVERLRFLMFEHMLRQPVAYFDQADNSTGALCARLSSEATNVESATGQRVGSVCQAFGAVVLALIFAFTHEWRTALVFLAFFPLVAIVVFYEMKATKLESVATIKSLERSTKVAIEAVSNIRTVASLGREPSIIKTYEEHLVPALRLMRRSAQLRGLVDGLSRSMFNFMNSAALVYGGYRIVSHGVKYENLLITTQSLQMATNTAQNAFTYLTDFHKGSLAATRIVAMLRVEPTMRDPEVPAISPFVSSGSASFKDVEFRYPTRRGQKVLKGLDLLVEPGKTIALVGESGCGKSTIIKLLQRYYDPEKGIVALDDIPIQQLLVNEVRANLGLVSQEPVLFQRTVWENIAYGDNTRVFTRVEIEAAAKAANIHGFIITLPRGYHTNLGTKGLQLSGGQKQRVAIARALIRKPQILLLDEATSALDTESEKMVQDALDHAKEGRTCVMIAHRLSTVRDADVICVLKGGRLVEQGTHEELMALKGYYYELHRRM